MMPNILYSISEGLFISIFSVVIVFLILLLITLVVQSLQKIREKQEIIKEPEEEKIFSMEDIKDDDMMVAALVASIDYQEITQGDVKVTSVKEIN